jgi:hypothetical protein
MHGAIPPLPQYAFTAWCLVKHWGNFTFTSIQVPVEHRPSPTLLNSHKMARSQSAVSRHGSEVNVKFPLCLIKHHAMKYWGREVQLHSFLTSALDGGEWPSFMPRLNYSRYPLDRGLEGPQSRSECGGGEKFLAHAGNRTHEPRLSSPEPVAIRTELPRVLTWRVAANI